MPTEMTPFQAVTYYFDQACDRLGVSDEIRALMCTPDRSQAWSRVRTGVRAIVILLG